MDKFKSFNDNYGHPAGDRVLKQVAKILYRTARETDFVARYGGEEFVLILPKTDLEGAIEVAQRLRAAIEAGDWDLRPVTASFGVSALLPLICTPADLIASADEALYTSKRDGRNRVAAYDPLMSVSDNPSAQSP